MIYYSDGEKKCTASLAFALEIINQPKPLFLLDVNLTSQHNSLTSQSQLSGLAHERKSSCHPLNSVKRKLGIRRPNFYL